VPLPLVYIQTPSSEPLLLSNTIQWRLHLNRTSLQVIQASAAIWMWPGLFLDITQRRVAILYRRFGTTYRFHHFSSRIFLPLRMDPIPCPETSV
jgi:hypothetical protein